MKRTVTFGGNELELMGKKVEVGEKGENFTALQNDLTPLSLESKKGKVVIISVVPSIDTGVCELQTIRFNKEAAELEGLDVITISVDLPFAQGRFCANKGIESSITLSDHKDLDFGMKYGFVLPALRLLSRGIIVLDKDQTIKHVEYVEEITNHPDYDKALEVAKGLL